MIRTLTFLSILMLAIKHDVVAQRSFYIVTPDGYTFIPPGKMPNNDDSLKLQAFFISTAEITNGQYKEFLDDLLWHKDTAAYSIAKIQDDKWKEYQFVNAQEYSTWIDYPVVNISWEGADLYCRWLSKKLSQHSAGNSVYIVRLPSKYEWEWAAQGGLENAEFPWEGPYVRNSNGDFLAHFKVLNQPSGPCRVKQFPKNGYGIFDMAGNVAEMVDSNDIVKGGGWNSLGYELKIKQDMPYRPGPDVGFRPVISFYVQPKIESSCRLWQAKNFCDIPDTLNVGFEIAAEKCTWNVLKCEEVEQDKGWRGVHVRFTSAYPSNFTLKSKFENLCLKKKIDGKISHPYAIMWYGFEFDSEMNQTPFIGYMTNRFKAKNYNVAVEAGVCYDLIIFFDNPECGDIIIIDHLLETEIE